MIELDLQTTKISASLPKYSDFLRWVTLATSGHRDDAEISIKVVTESEIQKLNYQYRGKNQPTNVLSFPAEFPKGVEVDLIGDLVICESIVQRESEQQQKTLQAHWAHMVIHGTLHLLGYTHDNDTDAERMESLEIKILRNLGYDNPYQST